MKVANKLDLVRVEPVIEKTLRIAKRDDLQNCNFDSVIYPVCLKIVGDDLGHQTVYNNEVRHHAWLWQHLRQ